MASIASVYVEILPTTGKIAAGIERALRDADADIIKAAKRWKKEIDAEMRGVDVEVDADTAKAKKEIERVEKGRYTAKIDVSVDKASAAKARREIKSAASDLGGKAGGAAKLEGALAGISLAPNVVPAIGSVVQAAGQLSGVLGLIPAAAGAAGLAIGSLKIATSGFGDALKAMGDPKKFGDAVAQLAPNAQQAARSIQQLMPQVTQLKMTVQDAFFQGFGQEIQKLGTTYLPVFQQVMGQMAGSANRALTGVSKMLQTPQMQSDIKTFGANAASAFDILGGALQPVLHAFTDIATVGSSFLPQLAGTVKDLADRFAAFITNARETGKLHDWIQGGIDAFTTLKNITIEVWDTFKGLFEAADGGGKGFLATIEDLTSKLNVWVNSTEGQTQLKQFFSDAREELEKWLPVLENLPGIAANAFGGMKAASDQWFPIIRDLTQMLRDHPGLVAAAGAAWAGWKAISVVSDVAKTLNTINTLLGVTLPASAAAGGGKIATALAAITVPEWLLFVVSAGSVAAVAPNVAPNINTGQPGYDIPNIRNPRLFDDQGNPIGPLNPHQQPLPPEAPPGTVHHGVTTPYVPPHQGVTTNVGPVPPAPPPAPPIPAPPPYTPPAPSSSAPTPATPGDTGSGDKSNWSADWDKIAGAESGNNWTITYGEGPDVTGGLQIATATWLSHGGGAYAQKAYLASKQQQIDIAERILADAGPTQWPTTYRNHPDWFRPPGSSSAQRRPYYGGSNGSMPMPMPPGGSFPQGAGVTYTPQTMQSLGIPPLYTNPAGGGAAQIPQWVQDFVKEHGGPSLVAQSTPHPGLHGAAGGPGWAIDVTGNPTEMDRLAQFLVDNPSASAQLIHQGAGGKQYGVAGGVNVSGSYYGNATYASESGMVHWAPSGTPTATGWTNDKNNPMYVSSVDKQAQDPYGAKQLGQDIVSGMLEIFGFGDIFPDPTQFGLFKIFKSIMGLKPGSDSNGGSTNADTGSGGGGLLDWAMSLVPGAGGNSVADDLAQWAPGSGGQGNAGLTDFASQFVPPGPTNNVDDHSFNLTVTDPKGPVMDAVDNYYLSAMRNLPK